jgi:hypothetical protein
MNKPILSKQAFWDVDMDKIDYENDVLNILERLIYRGTWEDFLAIRNFYGDKKINEEIVYAKCFGPKEVNFCCLIFNLKITDFIYYKEGLFRAYPEFKNCPDDFEYPDYAGEILRRAS